MCSFEIGLRHILLGYKFFNCAMLMNSYDLQRNNLLYKKHLKNLIGVIEISFYKNGFIFIHSKKLIAIKCDLHHS